MEYSDFEKTISDFIDDQVKLVQSIFSRMFLIFRILL